VVPSLTTAESTLLDTKAFLGALEKEVVEVRDQAGFVVNALLFPYLNHAVKLLDNRVSSKEGIDAAMKLGCGHPMGPLALLDLVGLDTSVAIMNALYAEFADPSFAPAPLLKRMVAAGKLGRKSGEGFYVYGE
jgi:3-hydroxybutyryl-CoA dehydrogenase